LTQTHNHASIPLLSF